MNDKCDFHKHGNYASTLKDLAQQLSRIMHANTHVCYTIHCKRTPLRVKHLAVKRVAEQKLPHFSNPKKDTELQTTAPFKWM